MGNLVNIIHPYTYKLVKKDEVLSLVIGDSCKEYEERDRKVVSFLDRALGKTKILRYDGYDPDFVKMNFQKTAIEFDPVLNLLKDSRVESFHTLPNGFPLPDEVQDNIGDNSFGVQEVISHSNLRKKLEGYSPLIFFGGAFEACLGNTLAYCTDEYQISGKDIFCIKDLCASFDEKQAKEMERELLKRDIQIINSEEALKLLN